MDSTLVIKVKYGDTLRRFNAKLNENEELDLDMDGLRKKILGLFNFPPDADFTLTYVDEDGDIVTLVDDDDLRDVMRQRLKFLRVDVQLNTEKSVKSSARSSGSSTPLRSPSVPNPFLTINTGVSEVLKSVPEPLLESLSKLSLDLTSKAVSVNPVLGELVDCLSKMGQPFLNPTNQSQPGTESSSQTGTSAVPMGAMPNTLKDACVPEALPKSASLRTSQELSNENVSRGVMAPTIPAPTPALVDLNLDPPCEVNQNGFTVMNFAPASSCTPAGNDKKETKKRSGKIVSFGGTSKTDPTKTLGDECPFSGMPVANDSTVPPIVNPINPFKRSNVRNNAMVGMFHRGVQCDGCGVHPIVGPRYKSKVKEDYDLCSICFAEMGNEADYIKMDRPVSYRHPRHLRFHDPNYWVGLPQASHMMRNCALKAARPKLDSLFTLDVNVLDGTMMAPSTRFTKIWRMRNSGTVAWPQGAQLVWIGGDRFSLADSVELEIPVHGLPVDEEIDIAVDFSSPELPGRYISYWRMASPSGSKFGQRVWVLIQVDDSLKESPCDNFQGLNLNLPPGFNGSKYPEITDEVVQPVVDGGLLEPSSVCVTEPVKPIVDKQPKEDQELNFPINDTLLVGHGVSASAPPEDSSSVSYPIIDISEAAPAAPAEVINYPTVTTSSEGVSANDAVERSLLKELEEMGFKQVDLNKEILKMNEYNLEQSLDDLCEVAEWDPILEDLQEMGFCDKETNRKLLKKNNGSIKGVVMDLLTGEKA